MRQIIRQLALPPPPPKPQEEAERRARHGRRAAHGQHDEEHQEVQRQQRGEQDDRYEGDTHMTTALEGGTKREDEVTKSYTVQSVALGCFWRFFLPAAKPAGQ